MTKPPADWSVVGDGKRSGKTGAYSKFAPADVVLADLIGAAGVAHSVADSWFGFEDSRGRSLVAYRVWVQFVWARSGAMSSLQWSFFR